MEVEGELVAVRSTEIGVPPVAEVDFKIAFLAPEGAPVKKGDSILRFDTEMLERQLAQKRAELDEAQKKVEQKEVDLRHEGGSTSSSRPRRRRPTSSRRSSRPTSPR